MLRLIKIRVGTLNEITNQLDGYSDIVTSYDTRNDILPGTSANMNPNCKWLNLPSKSPNISRNKIAYFS